MKVILTSIRVLVGALFIFSGLIKVNDPIGTAIKMEEYFGVFASEFSSIFEIFVPFALPIAVVMVVLEVALGVALIVNFKPRWTLSVYMILIVFFTFLTGYSAITNTVTDCGCFGDAIKLTPTQSFIKDIILLVLGTVLILGNKTLQSAQGESISRSLVIVSLIVSLWMSIHAIKHLPFIDFRAYKIGNNIPTQMQPSAPYIYEYVMEKEGKEYVFDAYPKEAGYKYIAMNHINPEASPKITDFAIWNDEGDFTEHAFVGNKLFIILYDVRKSDTSGISKINELVVALGGKIEVAVLTASDGAVYQNFAQQNNITVPFYYTDATVLKTVNRSNPGLWLLKDGTTLGHWHYNDTPDYAEIISLIK